MRLAPLLAWVAAACAPGRAAGPGSDPSRFGSTHADGGGERPDGGGEHADGGPAHAGADF